MAADIRLIAVDLDGTLLNPQNRVSDEDMEAVRQAVAAGVQVVLATSRWHHAARRTALALGVDGFIISHNGALVRSCDGARELLHHRIDSALAVDIARHIDSVGGNAYLTIDDRTFVRTSPGRGPSRLADDMAVCEQLESVVSGRPTAFLLFGKEAVASTIEGFRDHHGRELNLAEGFSESFPDYLNIVHALADKGAGLKAVCDDIGIPLTAAMAIGDAAPDIAMIKIAESGVAWTVRRFVFDRA